MSRTQHNSKGPGFEYWSRRPTHYKMASPSRGVKTDTHRCERRQSKAIIKEQISGA